MKEWKKRRKGRTQERERMNTTRQRKERLMKIKKTKLWPSKKKHQKKSDEEVSRRKK